LIVVLLLVVTVMAALPDPADESSEALPAVLVAC
jgi:hypothetical protein